VQSLDDAALRFLGRDHTAAEARRAAQAAARAFDRLSLDLIFGWPGQTADAWAEELSAALALGPEHVSAYQLTIETGTAFGRRARRGELAQAEERLAADLYETACEVLGGAGFAAYEVSNHARGPAAQSRHNLAYWRGWDYLGVGPGAHGRIATAQGRLATLTARRTGDYIARIATGQAGFESETPLTPSEIAEERLLTGLRTFEGVAFAELAAIGLMDGHPKVRQMVDAGLLTASPDRMVATASGRLVLDRVTSELALV
jgi:coproporphyrinogen III oxidase-like Fe-S oxidoreductase